MVDDLADVVIPSHPCPPARHSLREWYEEAATLDHLAFAPPDESLGWARADQRERRETVLRLTRSGLSLKAVARMVGDDIEAVALAIAKNDRTVPQIIAIDKVWSEHPEWGAIRVGKAVGIPRSYVQWLADHLGRETESARRLREGRPRIHDESIYEKIRELREKGWTWARIGKQFGLNGGSVYQMHKRRYGKVPA